MPTKCMKTSLSGMRWVDAALPSYILTVAISCDHRYINFKIWAIASLNREKNISSHSFFSFFFFRWQGCSHVRQLLILPIIFFSWQNCITFSTDNNTVLVTLSTNWLNYFIVCLLKSDWLGVLSAYSDSFCYRPGNARGSSALSR